MIRQISQTLIVLTLFGAYAVSAMILSAIGADIYSIGASNIENNYDMRTGALYLSEKIRQNDVENSIRIDQISGRDALVLTENKSGMGYESWIYVHNGYLREILLPPKSQFNPSAGQVIMPMKMIEADFNEQLLNITLYMTDEITEISIYPRSSVQEVTR